MIFEAGKEYKSKSKEGCSAVIVGAEKNQGNLTFEYQTDSSDCYRVPERDFWAAYYKDDTKAPEAPEYPEGTELTPNGLLTIDKPAHYNTKIDTIAFSKANFASEEVKGFMRINAIKYLQRYDKKDGLKDLIKARHYLNMLIEIEMEEA